MNYKKITISAIILLVIGLVLYFGPALIPTQPNNNQSVIDSNVNFTNEPLKITVLSTVNCKAFCDSTAVISEIEKRIGSVVIETVDATDPRAAELVKNYTINVLPVYVINASSLERNLNSRSLKDLVKRINSNYYILDTIETKSGFIFGRVPTENKTIDVYTSPYTKEAVNFYTENYALLRNFSNDYKVSYQLVTIVNGQKLFPAEEGYYFSLNESRRDACVQKLYPIWANDYYACRNRYIEKCFENPQANLGFCSANWKSCAQAYGTFNTTDIATCSETQADPILLDMHKKASNRLINAIPTLIVNDKYILVGEYNQTYIKAQLCKLNANVTACTN